MESDARPPEKLSNSESMDRNWNRWKHDFLIYMKLTGGINKPEDEKAAWLKNLIGQVGLEAIEMITFDNPDDKENMTMLLQKLEEYFDPPKNEIFERNKFFQRSKKNSESIDVYIEDLKAIAKFCNFQEQLESLVIDAVILDIKDKHLRNLLFEEKNLDLEKLKIVYKNYEIKTAKMKDISMEVSEKAKSVQTKSVPKKFVQKKPEFTGSVSEPKNPCRKCGTKHPMRACPAWGNTCCYCKQLHHFWYRCPKAESDGVQMLTVTDTVPMKPNFTASPFGIEKDSKAEKGYKNNFSSASNVDKEKNFVKREAFHADPLVNNFEIVESGNPKKVQNQFPTRTKQGMPQANFRQHPQTSQATVAPQYSKNNFQPNAKGGNPNFGKPPNYSNPPTAQRMRQSSKPKEKDSDCVIC